MLNDEESLKKENIVLESFSEEFNKKNSKINELKEKIEQEIIKINNLYDNIDKEITKSFEIKHQKLIEEENNLKENLQNQVTKTKEQLEKFLSGCNGILKNTERINKGIKKLENNKNMIKDLTYISTINKNKKDMDVLIQQLISNINITYKSEENNVIFDEYFFNGIPTPNNIGIKEISLGKYKLSWNIDDINLINLDKKNIKYIVEMRKENEKYKPIYSGSNNYCQIENLELDIKYEIKICSSYNDSISNWSKIYKIKITQKKISINFDKESIILGNNKEYTLLLKDWINPNKEIKAELLYRLTRDGDSYQTFHKNCDDKGPTLTLICDVNDIKTGGYTPLNWDSNTKWKYDNDTFLFSLTNKKKFAKPNNHNTESIYCLSSYGPWFSNYGFENRRSMKECKFQVGDSFLNANEIIPNENKSKYFNIKEVEVYKIIFK